MASALRRVTAWQRTKPLSELFWMTLRWLPKASLEIIWKLRRLPKASMPVRVFCMTLFRSPKASTLVRVMLTEFAEAILANVREIASAAVTTARVFMTRSLSGVALPITKGTCKPSHAHNLCNVTAITSHELLRCDRHHKQLVRSCATSSAFHGNKCQ